MSGSESDADDLDAGDPFDDTDAMERQADDEVDEVGVVSEEATPSPNAAVSESREPQEETATSESSDSDEPELQAPQTIPPGKRSPEAVAGLVVPEGVRHDPDGIPYALARSTATDDRKKAQVYMFDQTEKLVNTAHREFEEAFGPTKKADFREAMLLVGAMHLDEVHSLWEAWGADLDS